MPGIFLCVFVFSFFLFYNSVSAEEVKKYGVQFSIDHAKAVDSTNVRVTVGEDSRIIPRSSLVDFAVEINLLSPDRAKKISLTSLKAFTDTAFAAGDWGSGGLGAIGVLAHDGVEREAARNYFAQLEQRPELSRALKAALVGVEKIPVSDPDLAKILICIGSTDWEWVKSRYPTFSNSQLVALREELRVLELEAVSAKNFQKLDQLLIIHATLFGEDDADYREIRIVSLRFQEALAKVAENDFELIFNLSDVSKNSSDVNRRIAPLVVEIAHQGVADNIRRGEITRALFLLSRVDFNRRTPTTHDLTRQALEQVSATAETPLANAQLELFLRRMSGVDQRVQQAYVDALERQAHFLINSGRLDAVNEYIVKLAQVRPDPDSSNDRLRLEQGLGYLSRGMRIMAKQSIDEIQTGISALGFFKLLFASYYVDVVTLVLVLFVPLLVGLVIWLRYRAPVLMETAGMQIDPEEMEADDDESDEDRPSGFAVSSMRMLSPSMLEYNRCLEELGLQKGSPLRQIKSHYRALIKKVHPDLNSNLSAEERERFVTLTKTYDRLIELRRELKFPDT